MSTSITYKNETLVSFDNGTKTLKTAGKYLEDDIAVTTDGSGGGGSEKNQVIFIDYDGTELYEYTIEEAQALSALPPAPSHVGLTFQEWNYTLQEVKATTAPLVVGANYITADGKTRLYLTFLSIDDINISLGLYLNSGATVTIDWGDGTATETLAQTGAIAVPHTYNDGTYPYSVVISITVTGTGNIELSHSTFTSGILRAGNQSLTTTALRKVEMGDKVVWINSYAFKYCPHFETISINNICKDFSSSRTSSQSCFESATGLKAVVFPIICRTASDINRRNAYMSGCTSLRYATGAQNIFAYSFSGCYNLKMASFSFPASQILQNAFYNCRSLEDAIFPEGITAISSYAFAGCRLIRNLIIPNGVTGIAMSAFQLCYSLTSVTIPQSVTSMGASVFDRCYSLSEIHILCTTPPTLTDSSIFYGLLDPYTIYVPAASLSTYQTATNWSTFASHMVGE